MARSLLAPIVAFALVAGVAQLTAADGNAKQGHGGIFVFSGQSDPVAYTARDAAGPNAVGAPVNWLDLEPSDGVYNWSPLDDILRRAEKAHKKVSLRVYVNADGFFKATPDWFFALPGAQSYQTDFSAQQGIKLPIAWDPIFRAKFGEFLTALGHRYDGNRTIEYVQTLMRRRPVRRDGHGDRLWNRCAHSAVPARLGRTNRHQFHQVLGRSLA